MNREACYSLSYGIYIVCSKKEGRFNGQTNNTVFQITNDPITIAACINRKNLTHDYIKSSEKFTVSVLSIKTPLSMIGRFGFKSGRDIDKLKGIKTIIGKTGIPIIVENAVSYLEAEVKNSLEDATHTIFVGEVVEGDVLSHEDPMTYAYYHEVKRGTEPENAPLFRAKKKKEEKTMSKYECTVCGYVYDPNEGDPDNGIAAGTAFEDLPDDWVCPMCGAPKDDFEKME